MGKSIYLLLAYALFSACTVQVTAQKQVSEQRYFPFLPLYHQGKILHLLLFSLLEGIFLQEMALFFPLMV